jgi:isoleucyl-tRNA synthetase
VDAHLSNWFVRLSRRRFWKPARQQQGGPDAEAGGGDYMQDKISAYQTLYTCLNTIAKLMSPVAPFFSDRLFLDLNNVSRKEKAESVHLTDFPVYNKALVDKDLEERMALAQDISSMVLSLRKKTGINVRQPLNKILLPVLNKHFKEQVEKVKELILSETNIKSIEYIHDTSGIVRKKIKPNFKVLGQKVGKDMKVVADALVSLGQEDIAKLENDGEINLRMPAGSLNTQYSILNTDIEIIAEDIPGWQVTNLGKLTVALDVTITNELKQEGIARELVNRIQNLRKDLGFEVTDKIRVKSAVNHYFTEAINNNMSYICGEILAVSFEFNDEISGSEAAELVDIDGNQLNISITKA